MATNLFTLMATIGIDDSEYNIGIDGAKEKGEGFGSALATVGKGAKVAFEAIGAAAAAVGTAVGATAVQAFNASNQLEATQAKYSTVFGEFSDQSDEFISKFQELTPATKAEAQSMASSFQDLLVPMGIARDEATDMTGEFMHLTGALTNWNSDTMTATDVQAKFQSALLGEYSALASIGIQANATSVEQKVLEMGLVSSTDALKSMTIEEQKAVKAQALIAIATEQSSDALSAYNAESLDLKTSIGLLQASFTDLLAGAEGSGEQFGKQLTNTVKAFANKAPEFLNLATNIIDGLSEGLTDALPIVIDVFNEIIPQAVEVIEQAMPLIIDTINQIFPVLLSAVIENLPMLLSAGAEIIGSLAMGIIDMLPEIIGVALEIIITLANSLSENSGTIIDAITTVIIQLLTTLTDPTTLTNLITAGVTLIISLATGLVDAIPQLISVVPTIISNLVSTIISTIPQLIQAGIELLVALVEDLPTIITAIVSAIPQIIDSLITAIIGSIPQLIQAGVELLISLIENLPLIISTIITAVPEIVAGIVGAFIDNKGEIINVGKNLIEGIWEGIKNTGDWLWNQVSGFFGDLIGGIKDFLGIHSPSRVFAVIGKYSAEGVGVGFEDEMQDVTKTINKSIDFSNITATSPNINAQSSNGNSAIQEKQPIVLVVQLESGLEIARQVYDDINSLLRVDGIARGVGAY